MVVDKTNGVFASKSDSNDHASSGGPSDGSATTRAPVEKILAMVKGNGDDSYSKNSGFQAAINLTPQSVLNEGLERVALPSKGGVVVVADLGSSSGPNSIDSVTRIVDKLRSRCADDVEFQACFNDLPSNDFNNLFDLLSNDSSSAKNFYTAGIPGSFFKRLFARSSVHVFNSSLSVHWLSKIPDAVFDKDSPAYNKGNLFIRHSRSEVAKYYQQQAALDFKNFLQARAAELVSGGLLFLTFSGVETSEPQEPADHHFDEFAVDLNQVWTDLVAEGILTEEQRDNFNFPIYHRTAQDMRQAIETCDSSFEVLTVSKSRTDLKATKLFATSEPSALSRRMTGLYKAALNTVFEAQLGKETTEVIWQHYEKLVEKKIGTSPGNLKIEITAAI